MLYICNKIISTAKFLQDMQENDCLILFEDGIYNLKNTAFIQALQMLGKIKLYAIDKDLTARHCQTTNTSVIAISYEDFVHHCVIHDKIFQL